MDDVLNRVVQFKEKLHDFIDLGEHDDILTNDSYIKERCFFVANYKNKIPSFLKDCRNISDFLNHLRQVASGSGSRQTRRQDIEYEFKDFLNFLEFWESWEVSNYDESSFSNDTINIVLQKDVFDHVKSLLESGHYYSAVEESYKIVRERLKSITWKEKAHEWFKEENYEIIFWHEPQDQAEKDFFEWVKFLHMAIQNLRNEKVHKPAEEMDKNLAIHYIVLASLAYDLIDNNCNNEELSREELKEDLRDEIIKEYSDEWDRLYDEWKDNWKPEPM